MKTTVIVIYAIVSAALTSTAAADEYSVGSCADLMAVDETAVTSLVVTSSPIECEDYLRFVVRNDMTLTAATNVDFVVLFNIALKIKPGFDMVVEPDIEFRNVFEQCAEISRLQDEIALCRQRIASHPSEIQGTRADTDRHERFRSELAAGFEDD